MGVRMGLVVSTTEGNISEACLIGQKCRIFISNSAQSHKHLNVGIGHGCVAVKLTTAATSCDAPVPHETSYGIFSICKAIEISSTVDVSWEAGGKHRRKCGGQHCILLVAICGSHACSVAFALHTMYTHPLCRGHKLLYNKMNLCSRFRLDLLLPLFYLISL